LTWEDNLGLLAVVAHGGRDPVDVARPVDLPLVLAGFAIDAGDERFAGIVHRHDERLAGQHRRRGHADLVRDGRIIADERAVPQEIAVAVVGDEVGRGKQGINGFAVSRRRRRRHVRLRMTKRVAGRPNRPLPEFLAVGRVKAQNQQARLFRPVAGGDENPAVGHHRAGESFAGQFRLPFQVFGLAPLDRQTAVIGYAAAADAAELRPVGRIRQRRKEHQAGRTDGADDVLRLHFDSFFGLGGTGFIGTAFGEVRTFIGMAPPIESHTRH